MTWEEDEVASVYSCVAEAPRYKGEQVKPFFYSFIKDEFFEARPNTVEFRRALPLRAFVIVERKLDDSRWVVSADDPAAIPLRSKQQHFRHLYREEQPKEACRQEVLPGRDFLHVSRNDDVFRVRVVKVDAGEVSVRLLDFNVYDVVYMSSLYQMTESFVHGVDKFAFAGRINLPPRAITDELGLPNRDLVQVGDRLEIVLLSAVEPHLAVFGFAQSVSRRIFIDEMTEGLSTQEANNWTQLMRGAAPPSTPVELPMGFARLQRRIQNEKRLATIVAVDALDFVRVRDLPSSIRLAYLKPRLQDLYSNERFAKALRYNGVEEVVIGMGCVAEHPETKAFFRVHVLGFKEETMISVRPIDHPDIPPFYVPGSALFRPIAAINFARQVFSVAMTRHSKGILRYHLSQLANCLLPGGTPVILKTDPKSGLTSIFGTNAKEGVLNEIGFTKLGENRTEEYDSTVKMSSGFGLPQVVQPRPPENVDAYTLYDRMSEMSLQSGRSRR